MVFLWERVLLSLVRDDLEPEKLVSLLDIQIYQETQELPTGILLFQGT